MKNETLNLNIGILGHVDSGKTSLAKALSTTSSTAAFDKNPQSQERGITIDLGFSSVIVDLPDHLKDNNEYKWKNLQFTFVDCPGHASLIRTIIGGSQIVNMILLVIDINKGIQTQTAECLVIGEIMCPNIIVVLNKIDMVPESKRQQTIVKMSKKIKLTLANTSFKDPPIVSIAAEPGGGQTDEQEHLPAIGINELLTVLKTKAFISVKHLESPFVFAVDHCFGIRGQGTVMTGTVLQGTVAINDTVEIPSLGITKKVKSLQVFRQNVERAEEGDRLGLCVTQFDPKQMERGILSNAGYVLLIYAAIISVRKIKYYKNPVSTKAKFHVSIGYETVMAKITIFRSSEKADTGEVKEFDFSKDYEYQSELSDPNSELQEGEEDINKQEYALLEFEIPVLAVPHSLVIGSKLDVDIHTNTCRLAFHGRLLESISDKNYTANVMPNLKVYKNKMKTGIVDRVVNDFEVIGKCMFKKETNVEQFVGLKVQLSSGENGIIDSSFGKSGKVKIRILEGLNKTTLDMFPKKKLKSFEATKTDSANPEHVKFVLSFIDYIFNKQKKIIQR